MPLKNDPEEVDKFKRNINLSEYAASQGYKLDSKNSSKSSVCMRYEANDDKVYITKSMNGHYLYCSVRDDNDNGTIIDFIEKRKQQSLGKTRMELRPWIGDSQTPKPNVDIKRYIPEIKKSEINRPLIKSYYHNTTPAGLSGYLTDVRMLSKEIIIDPRFYQRIRVDAYKNIVIPHFDSDGVCGLERRIIKEDGAKRNSKGGVKGLWFSKDHPDEEPPKLMIVGESAFDDMSYCEIKKITGARFFAIFGRMNKEQPNLIISAILKLPANSEVRTIMDGNTVGRELTEMIEQCVVLSGRDDIRISNDSAPEGSDWNNELKLLKGGNYTPGYSVLNLSNAI